MKTNLLQPTRRQFLKKLTVGATLIASGGIQLLSAANASRYHHKAILRFVLASDGHYGQPKTEYNACFDATVRTINQFHAKNPLDACFVNGDIIHDNGALLLAAKAKLDAFTMPYYVTKGNHDMVSDAYWQEVWNTPVNHEVILGTNSFLLMTTSDEKGTYLSPDLDWLKEKLDAHQSQQNVFLVLHIPQRKWTANGIETPRFFELVAKYPNIKAVFHGHEHDQDGVKMADNIPYLFDAHFGGSWGTTYKGFRVVELLEDQSMLTYMMNPSTALETLRF